MSGPARRDRTWLARPESGRAGGTPARVPRAGGARIRAARVLSSGVRRGAGDLCLASRRVPAVRLRPRFSARVASVARRRARALRIPLARILLACLRLSGCPLGGTERRTASARVSASLARRAGWVARVRIVETRSAVAGEPAARERGSC